MNLQEKTRHLLDVLDKRSNIAPRSRLIESRIASIDLVPWKSPFCIFHPVHSRAASKLMKLFLAAKDFDDFLEIAGQIRESENDGLFLYALYSSVRHRDDCIGVVLPPIEERAPYWYFAAETIHEAIQKSIHQPNDDHLVVNQRTALDSEPESRLAYFREDIGINRHHWSWHLIFPTDWDETAMGKIKDRKGELFYYMHQQMIARYDCERLSNGLNRVLPLNFQEDLPAYSSNLTSQTTGVHFAFRPHGLKLRDVSRDDVNISLQEMKEWTRRIFDAIDQGSVRDVSGKEIPLRNEKGIDMLGAIVEASSSSVNRSFYGNLHNMGHLALSYVQDPDGRYRQYANVMAFVESAVRDPVFFRWHKFIDIIFQRHKATLEPYTRKELSLKGIRILSADVKGKEKNIMETFMRESRSDLSNAHFLNTNGKILVKYEHLDHEPLTFIYKVENTSCKEKNVTMRVFLAPKYDESGDLLKPNEQRLLMVELDKIRVHLKQGINLITRMDLESSVTTKREIRSYRSLKAGNVEPEVDHCSCGWPQHMLLPRGKSGYMEFTLFVMCTDYNEDKPDMDQRSSECTGAVSYCGSKNQKYPDRKPMGFPFDRRIEADTLQTFLTDNMSLTDVKIKFMEETQPLSDWTVQMY